MSYDLCRVSDLPDPGAKGPVAVPWQGAARSVFVVRIDGRVTAFVNDCPHVHAPLHMEPDRFLDLTGSHILCSMHGAHFDPVSGLCLSGPCKGRSLTPVPVRVDDGWVRVQF